MRVGITGKDLLVVAGIILLVTVFGSWPTSKFQIEELRGLTQEQVRKRYCEPSVENDRSKRHQEFYPDSTEVWWDYSGMVMGSRARVVFRDGVVSEVSTDYK